MTKQVFVRSPFEACTRVVQLLSGDCSVGQLAVQSFGPLPMEGFWFLLNGTSVCSNEMIDSSIGGLDMLEIRGKLLGGKGGFGSQMKKEAMSQKKITNWDLSRDLQGRRVRDVNNEKKLVEFLKKQKEEETLVDKEMKNYKAAKKVSGAENFGYHNSNNDYRERTEEGEDTISNSVALAFLNARTNKKKKAIAEEEDQQLGDDLVKKLKTNEETEPQQSSIVETEQQPEIIEVLSEEKLAAQAEKALEEEKKANALALELQKLNEKKQIAMGENNEFAVIELFDYSSAADLSKLGDSHLKNELTRLGLKVGGTLDEKAQRLWAIKLDPANLFNPKFMAKKK